MPIDDSHQRHIVETPEILQDSLEAFDSHLQEHVSSCPIMTEAHQTNEEFADPNFRLMFLRTDLFDTKLAVDRFLRYWRNRKKLFGHLSKVEADMETVDRGYARLVRNHERVVIIDPTRIADSYEVTDIVQSLFFVLHHAITNSEEAQKRGVVYLIDCKKALDLKYLDRRLIQKSAKVFNDGFPIRVTAVIIMNLHSFGQSFISIFKLFMKPAMRSRIKVLKNAEDKQKLEQFAGLDHQELQTKLGYEPWKK